MKFEVGSYYRRRPYGKDDERYYIYRVVEVTDAYLVIRVIVPPKNHSYEKDWEFHSYKDVHQGDERVEDWKAVLLSLGD